jgi:hypothetical protein
MTQTILPRITPQQQLALTFRGFGKPEGRILPTGEVHVWALNLEGAWIEALGVDENRALYLLALEAKQPVRS